MTVPCYNATHKYRGKTVTFRKPLFPGYAFPQMAPNERGKALDSGLVANLLDVFDQETFAAQLNAVMQALETNLEQRLALSIGEGARIRIVNGPLRGVEGDGWRSGMA